MVSNVCQIFIHITLDTLDNTSVYIRHTLIQTVNIIKGGQRKQAYEHTYSKANVKPVAQFTCSRCGGLMVREFCLDLLNSTGEPDLGATLCAMRRLWIL